MAIESSLSAINPGVILHLDPETGHARLDADLYQVDDIHGVTEGLTGSGNLNYLVLQSGQTDEIRRDSDPFNMREGNLWFSNGGTGLADHAPQGLYGDGNGSGYQIVLSGGAHAANDAAAQILNAPAELNGTTPGASGFYNSAADSFDTALNFYGSNQGSAEFSRLIERVSGGGDGRDGANADGRDGHDGNDGGNGGNGTDGHDGHNPHTGPGPGTEDPGTTDPEGDTDLHGEVHTHVADITLDVLLDPVEHLVGDIDIDTGTTLDLSPILQGHLPDIGVNAGALLLGTALGVDTHPITSPLTNSVNHVLDTLDPVINPVLDILPPGVTDVLDGFNQHGDTDLAIGIGGTILDLPLVSGGIDIPLDPLETILGDIDIDITPDLNLLNGGGLSDLGLNVVFNGQALVDLDVPGILHSDAPLGDILGIVPDPTTGTVIDPILESIDPVTSLADDLAQPVDHILAPALDPLGNIIDQINDVGPNAPDIFNGLIDDLDNATGLEDSLSGTLDPLADILDSLQSGGTDLTTALSAPVEALAGVTEPLVNGLGDVSSTASGIVEQGLDVLAHSQPWDPGIIDGAALLGQLLGQIENTVEFTSPPGDTDLTVHTGIDIADMLVNETGIAVTLDPVEAIIGDIDIDAGLDVHALVGNTPGAAEAGATVLVDPMEGLLGELSNSLMGNGILQDITGSSHTLPGVSASAGAAVELASVSWPEASIAGTAHDIVSGIGGALHDTAAMPALPDPVGHIAEGLGSVVDHSHAAVHHALGGLFG